MPAASSSSSSSPAKGKAVASSSSSSDAKLRSTKPPTQTRGSSKPAGSGIKAVKALSPPKAAAGSSKAAPIKDDAEPKAASKRPPIFKPDIFVRIRPLAAEGGHAEDGTVLQKHLEAWDETSVTIETQYSFSKGEAKYAYPKKVFGTEATQTEVTDAMVPDLVASFADEGQSVLFFAYGQTGTGKTRTMLGTEPSLASATPHEDWGVFPRVCQATFEKMAALRQAGTKCVLTASALEFYLGECYDLLSSSERAGNAPVQIDFLSHLPSGESCVVLEQPSELLAFLAKVIANRSTRATNFNKASAEHSGSSRSHAALILTLMTLDESRNFSRSSFTLVDLAGAERPDKVHAEKAKAAPGGMEFTPEFLPAIIDARDSGKLTPKKMAELMPINFQTRVINHELFSLGSEVVKASEAHRKGKPYAAPKSMVTPTIKFLSAIMDGKARLAMCVTLSPAGQNAWETWFSLQYGADLAKLHAPRRKDKPQNIDKLQKSMAKEAEALKKEVDGMGKDHRYYPVKKHKADDAAEKLRRLELVLAA